jgi:uncharacterized small protein (DUF1192 family)
MSAAKPRHRRIPHTNVVGKRLALNEHIAALQQEITRLRRERAAVSRNEFKEVIRSLHQLERNTDAISKHTHDLETQFTRIAQLQTEVDVMKRALRKAGLLD